MSDYDEGYEQGLYRGTEQMEAVVAERDAALKRISELESKLAACKDGFKAGMEKAAAWSEKNLPYSIATAAANGIREQMEVK